MDTIIIRKIDNGYVVKTTYPKGDFDHEDGEEYLQDPADILAHVKHTLDGGSSDEK